MRIDDLNRTPLTQGSEKTESAGESRTVENAQTPATRSDQADVSLLARALSSSDPQRLEQLRAAVQQGTYHVPAEAVAKAIIDFHRTE